MPCKNSVKLAKILSSWCPLVGLSEKILKKF
jgi:hypothetical protein